MAAASGTRSWREARGFAAWIATSQGAQRAAASAGQYTAAVPPHTAQAAAPPMGLVLLPSLPIYLADFSYSSENEFLALIG
jgi:hypothetical protein